MVRPKEWYGDHDVEVMTGREVRALDLDSRTVAVEDDEIGFDRLLLATGSSARRIPAVVEQLAENLLRAEKLRLMEQIGIAMDEDVELASEFQSNSRSFARRKARSAS